MDEFEQRIFVLNMENERLRKDRAEMVRVLELMSQQVGECYRRDAVCRYCKRSIEEQERRGCF